MTLEDFVKQAGSARAAAKSIGVDEVTISRWRHGHNEPVGVQRVLLESLGIELPTEQVKVPAGGRMTLARFIRSKGTITRAAAAVGVTRETMTRWRRGLTKPDELAVDRLKDLGVDA